MPKGTIPTSDRYYRESKKTPPGGAGANDPAVVNQSAAYNALGTTPLPNVPTQAGDYGFGSQPTYYQVKKNDTSLGDVASQTGVPIQNLAEMNKTKSLPPTGSFIKLQEELNLVNQGVPTTIAERIIGKQASAPATGSDPYTNIAAKTNQGQAITQQFANGQYPSTIPASLVHGGYLRDPDGAVITLTDLYAEGYSMNASGVLVRGAGTGSGVNGERVRSSDFSNYGEFVEANKAFLNQKRWDPATKKYVTVGKLIKQGRLNVKTGKYNKYGNKQYQRRRSEPAPAAPPPPPAPNTREGPDTILDIHLGSG